MLAMLLLGGTVAFGLSGMAGGPDVRTAITGPDATLAVDGPSVIRNGEYDELVVSMAAHRDLANATLVIDADYWRDLTINTMIPAPEKGDLHDGAMRFEFGALAAGSAASFKIDAQVNPHRFGSSHGDFVLLDGNRELARLPRSLRVLP